MSPIGSGLATQCGLIKESAYGTRLAPTQFYEFMAEGSVSQQNYLESKQLRSGRFFQSASRRVLTTSDAQVSLNGEVPNKNFGSIIDLLHGNTVTPVQNGATTAYTQTHNLTGNPTKSATVQVGKPDANGTIRPFDYIGCMLNSFSLSCAVDDWLKFALTMDSQDEDTTQTLATASYPTNLEGFHFQEATVTVNGVVQNLTTGALVKAMALDLSLPRNVARYGLRASAFKAQPILNDYTPGTGSIDFEFDDLTQYGLYQSGAKVPVIFDFTSNTSNLAGVGFPYKLTITMASCQFTGTTPVVAGPDVLAFSAPFSILDDGTNAPVVFAITETRTTAL